MQWSTPNADADQHSIGAQSISSNSQPNSDAEDGQDGQDGQDRAVRALQRKIKGVLPASWLRLDKEKQKERISSTQQNRDKAASHRQENAKGVAKKITRASGSAAAPNARAQLTSMNHLADDENDEDDDNGGNGPSAKGDSHLTLADVVGFENPYEDMDDIPEDNRIDSMFPPIPRGPPSSSNHKQGTKRHRPAKSSLRTGNKPKALAL